MVTPPVEKIHTSKSRDDPPRAHRRPATGQPGTRRGDAGGLVGGQGVGRQRYTQQVGHVTDDGGAVLTGGEGEELTAVVEVAGAGAQRLLRQARLADAAHAGDEDGATGLD